MPRTRQFVRINVLLTDEEIIIIKRLAAQRGNRVHWREWLGIVADVAIRDQLEQAKAEEPV